MSGNRGRSDPPREHTLPRLSQQPSHHRTYQQPSFRAETGIPARMTTSTHIMPVVGSWTAEVPVPPYTHPGSTGGSFGVPRNPPDHNPGVQLPTINGRSRLPPLSEGNRHSSTQSQGGRSRSGTPQSPGSARSRAESGTPAPQRHVDEFRSGRQLRPPPCLTADDPTGAGPVRMPRHQPAQLDVQRLLRGERVPPRQVKPPRKPSHK
ncbi:hypothetical protein ASPVEDRAFT_32214 [Aspergillus versicolor CBS 583.65]|uniref:Uncharacterized protein n=1 Tax=Aspergillus versicolor CBS 583.65 TaxID=1036611 RepID=A0A1L9PWF7_ASPVE|nr:uncharacterized protein ASPVEDRAFT_32214 [Aspergillus versicolor CBS 583.65]OJJ05869.1 hypothetical protein ASPVEDRAFT_32214 [Aspergillus versicolor CBS 583.65]